MKDTVIKVLLPLFFLAISISGFSQLQPVYEFQQDDTILRKSFYEQALQKQKALLSSIGNEHKDDYKRVYESRFNGVSAVLQSSRTVSAKEPHEYLQGILKKITDSNKELQGLQVRLVFSRDWWPNAYSMGEGTLVVNAGLMIFLENEAELVFVLCHELAHYYLQHGDKDIKKNVETVNSEAFKQELKRLSKEEFRIGQQLEALFKNLAFDNRRHSRANEAEADRYAFQFMKKTGYDCNGIKTCLNMLDTVDDSLLYRPINIEQVFNFKEYPFKKRWIQKESAIFSQMKDEDSPLTKKERDSLKTHPDCDIRIILLEDSIKMHGTGQAFLVNEPLFKKLKKDFFVEMTEQEFRDKNLTRNLYYSLLMLQNDVNVPFAIYSIARALNEVYESQKNHEIGKVTAKEYRGNREDYNLLLRMIDRLKLDEIAELSYQFCSYYQPQMTGYKGFEEELQKAQQNKK